jgi:hypothetical protein
MLGCSSGAEASVAPVERYDPLPGDEVPIDFFREIQPLLGDHCVRCHGGVRELGQLNLQSRARAASVLGRKGNPNSSRLWLRVRSDEHGARMPLGQPELSPDKLEKLRRWLYQGAPWPQHWSFAPLGPVDPAAVAVNDETWPKTPVDRFILQRLERAGLAPSPEASKLTLIRRLALDLTGLPPTRAEAESFVADSAPTAYEGLVDRLLAAPSFGERWARHWLDQARYADSDGYEKDNPRPNAWRYRDWVVDSLNADQPFDQFTIEQIAGDLLPAATPPQRLATGFSRNTLFNAEGGVDPEEDRTKRVLDRAATVGTAWLGLTLGCTQCHSHPYDPISQKEFYRLYAFFDNADESTTDAPVTSANPAAGVVPVDVLVERTEQRRLSYLFQRGDFLNPDKSEALSGGTPGVLPPLQPRRSTADRLDLAHWLVSPQNPLTPRVAVNSVWSHLFGHGLVTTLEDFGARASFPSHPELLDWLAQDFVSHGFSRKRLIKQLVMSATYRQASAVRPDVTVDLENTLLYRQNRLRVEAEIVADSFLSISGLLSTKRGGPAVYPPLPPELKSITYDGIEWPTSSGEDAHRRALYTWHQRVQLYPSLASFDRPSASVSVSGRPRSNTPLQPLVTLHDPVFVEAAQAFARRVQRERLGSLAEQIDHAFWLALGRPASPEEVAELQRLYDASKLALQAAPDLGAGAVGPFLPEGVDSVSAAAWVSLARVILNLDELITRE